MQQPESGERIEGRRLDVVEADDLAALPYERFLDLWLSSEPSPEMIHALMIRHIKQHYRIKELEGK